MRVLIVEDERRLAESLSDILKENNYIPDIVYNGEDGLYGLLSGIYDAAVVDVMLPKMNGFDVVRKARLSECSTPILMLTARSEVSDRVEGLDCGADYYLTKPFEISELLACIRAIARRQGEVIMDELSFGGLSLSLSSCMLKCGELSVRLSSKEFEIMRILLANKENIVSKETLLIKVWGYETDASDNHVEVYLSFLRKKLRLIRSTVRIEAVRMIGYCLKDENYVEKA